MDNKIVNVVLFSGGRGSSVLTRQLLRHSRVKLSLIINGYDDGLSTGEVRRFLGDCLGPSDFRKNASRVALETGSCQRDLIDILDLRFPLEAKPGLIHSVLDLLTGQSTSEDGGFFVKFNQLYQELDKSLKTRLGERMDAFRKQLEQQGGEFDFQDCSIGNLVFAGCFLVSDRRFNAAVEDYSGLLGLDNEVIVNVTQGENAFLVALNQSGEYLESEADIVDADRRNHIRDIFLIEQRIPATELEIDGNLPTADQLREKQAKLMLNPQAQQAIENADLIVYAPGTQHSSLFPSYMTPNLGRAIAGNVRALKLLVTNIEEDAEIPDLNAVEIIDKAVFYLREKNSRNYPVSSLLTHYLINLPDAASDDEKSYVPLGNMESIEDPRLIRISNYEDQVTGNHDPEKVLSPFIDEILAKKSRLSVGVLLTENRSANKVVQTILEMTRSPLRLPYDITVYYRGELIHYLQEVELEFTSCHVEGGSDASLLKHALSQNHDYLCLMECSGMYHGYDVISLLSNLNQSNVDAVWGSRRLSVSDMRASYKFRYHHHVGLGIVSYVGSYLLSLSYLFLYGQYISDTLSGLRLIRSEFLSHNREAIDKDSFNQYLLSDLLGNRGRVFEVPVDFLPMSPHKVKRTGIRQGIDAFRVIALQRLKNLFQAPH